MSNPQTTKIPASEAPDGRWCIGFLPPVEIPSGLPEGGISHRATLEMQTVKLGGKWWVWDKDRKSLIPFTDDRGWVVFPWGSAAKYGPDASGPEEVVVIPIGVIDHDR